MPTLEYIAQIAELKAEIKGWKRNNIVFICIIIVQAIMITVLIART